MTWTKNGKILRWAGNTDEMALLMCMTYGYELFFVKRQTWSRYNYAGVLETFDPIFPSDN